MLPHPTYDRLIALGLVGMAKAFEEQRQQPAVASLMFEERIGILVDREAVERESRRLVTRLKFANLRQTATIEDLNTKAARGLDKALFAKLATGDWIGRRQDLLITGKTGTGKSWLACALGHKACRDGGAQQTAWCVLRGSLRIPANADSDSDRMRTAIPIDRGQRSGDRGQWLPSTALRAHSAVSVSSFPRLGAFSGGLRRVSPSRARRCAVWTRRSRTASAIVGSMITSCQ